MTKPMHYQFSKVNYGISFLIVLLITFLCCSPIYAEEEGSDEADNTKYFELSPPFVVNLQTNERRMRFLQVRIQILGTPAAIEQVQTHNAPLRDVIITQLSEQSRESVNTPKKKKALQDKVQAAAETVLKDLTGSKQIEGLYFTNFVIQ